MIERRNKDLQTLNWTHLLETCISRAMTMTGVKKICVCGGTGLVPFLGFWNHSVNVFFVSFFTYPCLFSIWFNCFQMWFFCFFLGSKWMFVRCLWLCSWILCCFFEWVYFSPCDPIGPLWDALTQQPTVRMTSNFHAKSVRVCFITAFHGYSICRVVILSAFGLEHALSPILIYFGFSWKPIGATLRLSNCYYDL